MLSPQVGQLIRLLNLMSHTQNLKHAVFMVDVGYEMHDLARSVMHENFRLNKLQTLRVQVEMSLCP